MYRPSNALAQTEAADNAAHNASAPATPLAVASRTTDAGPASIASSLYTAFLVGLFAEHIYLVVRAGVRHALGRLLWDESEEALAVARQEYQLKKQAIGKLDAQTRTPVAAADAPSDFWQVDPMDELQRFVKKE